MAEPAPPGTAAAVRTAGPVEHEYRAATQAVARADRSGGARIELRGRAPEQVLAGLVSGKIPAPYEPAGANAWRGRAEGSALLTPKGKMIAMLRLRRAGPAAEDGFVLDVPPACAGAATEHLRKFVPPRLATIRDVSAEKGLLTLLGPGAVDRLAELLIAPIGEAPADGTPAGEGPSPSGAADLSSALRDARDGDLMMLRTDGGIVAVVRTTEVATPAFDVIGPADLVRGLVERLAREGVPEVGADTWAALRIEAGEPAFGADMDESTIPVEAGIHPRVVDYQKGCFTGQEVLVRIRDRGHVNRHLRGLLLGEVPPPPAGTPLFTDAGEREVGVVTSATRSPRFGETIALGYVRREVAPPAELRLGAPDGPPVGVRSLESGWRPAAGSP